MEQATSTSHSAAVCEATELMVRLKDYTGLASGYKLMVSKGGINVKVVNGMGEKTKISGLEPNTEYSVKVRRLFLFGWIASNFWFYDLIKFALVLVFMVNLCFG